MKVQRKDVLKLWKTLQHVESLRHNVKFSYFIAKNKVTIKPEIEALEAVQAPSKEYLEYEGKRVELAQLHAKKDDNGNPTVKDRQYVIMEEKADEFAKGMEKIKKKYKEALEGREEQINDFNKLLEEEVEFEPVKLELKQFPENISPAAMEVFIELDLLEE